MTVRYRRGLTFVAAAILSLGICACGSRPAPTAPSPSPSPSSKRLPPSYAFHGHEVAGRPVSVEDNVQGHAMYRLNASDVFYTTSSSKGTFRNNTILFYKGSAVRLRITAPTGDVNTVTYDFVLRGGVHAQSATGVTLDSDSMAYNGKTQLLTALGHVRAVDAQGDTLTGDKAVADLDLQQIHMTGNVGVGRER